VHLWQSSSKGLEIWCVHRKWFYGRVPRVRAENLKRGKLAGIMCSEEIIN